VVWGGAQRGGKRVLHTHVPESVSHRESLHLLFLLRRRLLLLLLLLRVLLLLLLGVLGVLLRVLLLLRVGMGMGGSIGRGGEEAEERRREAAGGRHGEVFLAHTQN
jgi:hypothetical protein